jgi:purine-binding chemotaxis protein CheW
MESRQRHDPSKSLVGFLVGAVHYAVPIARIREIANPLDLVALPRAPDAVVGVSDYRGDIVAVVDLRRRFGLPPAALTRKTKWLLVDVIGRTAAIVVDAVTEVFGTGGAELRPAPSLGGGDDTRGIVGATRHAGALVFVLDTSWLAELTESLAQSGAIAPAPQPSVLPESS